MCGLEYSISYESSPKSVITYYAAYIAWAAAPFCLGFYLMDTIPFSVSAPVPHLIFILYFFGPLYKYGSGVK